MTVTLACRHTARTLRRPFVDDDVPPTFAAFGTVEIVRDAAGIPGPCPEHTRARLQRDMATRGNTGSRRGRSCTARRVHRRRGAEAPGEDASVARRPI